MRTVIPLRPSLALIAILITTMSCIGSAPPAPTTSPNAVGTVVAATIFALTQQAAFNTPTSIPATAAQPSPVPPTFPPIGPTQILPNAARINFLTGATTGVVTAPIPSGGTQFYVLKALQGQPMILNIDSVNHDVTLSLKTQGGTTMLNPASKQSSWQGILPQTEDYYIGVYGGATTENFTLSVQIPARIKFASGADSATVSGKTAGGYNVAYVLFAGQNQKMSLSLNGVGGNAVLSVYGYTDGQPYLRYVTEQTTFDFTLPATQDYIVQVVPRAGQVVSYTLFVKIK